MSEFWEAVAAHQATPNDWPIARILSQPADDLIRTLETTYETIITKSKEIYIYGAGQNGRRIATLLAARKLVIAGFLDDTNSLQGKVIDGVTVYSPAILATVTKSTLVIVSIFSPTHSFLKTQERLEKFDCNVISLHAALFAFGRSDLPFYFVDVPLHFFRARSSILELCRRLTDDDALNRLWRFLVFCLTFNHKYSPIIDSHRFNEGTRLSEAIFVDGGAFDGDTLKLFLRMHGNSDLKLAYAFEPDVSNFKLLNEYVGTLPLALQQKIKLHNSGLWKSTTQLNYVSTGTPASHLSASGDNMINVCALDDVCSTIGQYIVKLDVEGAEKEALQGMQRLIREQCPYIEVAIYHKPADIYRLAELIVSFSDQYSFDLRSYGYDGADTMLCAIPR